ncbi:MAG: single-stranded DNA-binding protein [Methanomicrobia archaeon]|nr:single-stranded DNA-binding protein [Methanomicrobia archaeon]MCK4637286.1 single-stranded DNA-binding protein [Methanomicrobia archaeon]
MKIEELGPRNREIEMNFKVVSIGEENEVVSKRDGSSHKFAEAVVGDETATIIMTLWDDDIGNLEEGKTYKLENGYTTLFRSSLRLNSGRYGKIEEVEEEIEVNSDNDMSEKEFRREYRRRY